MAVQRTIAHICSHSHCTLKEHKRCNVEPVSDVVASERAKLQRLVAELAQHAPLIDRCAASATATRRSLDRKGAEAKTAIREAVGVLRAALERREATLIGEVWMRRGVRTVGILHLRHCRQVDALVSAEAERLYDANAEKATAAAKQVQHLVEFAAGVCGGGGDTFVLEIKASLEASIREMLALNEGDFDVDEPVVACRIDTHVVVATFDRALCSPYGVDKQVDVVSSLVPMLRPSVPDYTANNYTCLAAFWCPSC
jgi:hypothetical protein